MTTVKEALRNKILEAVVNAAGEEIDGREVTKNFDKLLDEKFGEGTSEKIQRGAMTDFLLEMVEGLFDEDRNALIARAEAWVKTLKSGEVVK